MVGWHHRLNGHKFEETLEDGQGQGSMVCCSPWGCQELDATEQLNNKEHTHTDVLTSNGPSDLSEPSLSLVSFLDALPHVPTWCSKIFSNSQRESTHLGKHTYQGPALGRLNHLARRGRVWVKRGLKKLPR